VPYPILFGLYTPKDTIWLSMAGYGAGYMHEFVMHKEEPIQYTKREDTGDTEFCSFLYRFSFRRLL
jgi:hypothetical protein